MRFNDSAISNNAQRRLADQPSWYVYGPIILALYAQQGQEGPTDSETAPGTERAFNHAPRLRCMLWRGFLLISTSYGSTISFRSKTYDYWLVRCKWWCKIKVRGQGLAMAIAPCWLLPQIEDLETTVPGSVPCNIISIGHQSPYYMHNRQWCVLDVQCAGNFKYFRVQVTQIIGMLDAQRRTAESCCQRFTTHKLPKFLSQKTTSSVSFGDPIELRGGQLYNSDKADTHIMCWVTSTTV